MGKPFAEDAEYLNDVKFGTLLQEIGRVQLRHVPKDPEAAFIERVEKYQERLQAEVDKMREEGALAKDPRPLRTLGLLRTLLQLHSHRPAWRTTLINFLRGMIRFERDHSREEREVVRKAA